jgi:hypothetical protein
MRLILANCEVKIYINDELAIAAGINFMRVLKKIHKTGMVLT